MTMVIQTAVRITRGRGGEGRQHMSAVGVKFLTVRNG